MSLKEAFVSLYGVTVKMGLKLNENKTKYLTTRKKQNQSEHIENGNFKIETMHNFIYLGSLINEENDNFMEIKKKEY